MKYKAVIFDLFGTLIEGPSLQEYESTVEEMATALSIPSIDFVRKWNEITKELMKGIIQCPEEAIKHVCKILNAQPDDTQIYSATQILCENVRNTLMTSRTDAIEVLSYLKSNGYRTGLISDCSTETTSIWKDTALAPLIDVAVFSCSVGLMKPDPRIYQIAIERLAVEPGDCLYIADGIGQELTSASQIGMQAVLIRVSGEDSYDPYREDWDGSVISSLREVLDLVR